jgi:hypothetical protein
MFLPIPVDKRQQGRFIFELIDLVQEENRWYFGLLDEFQHESISFPVETDASRINAIKSTPCSASLPWPSCGGSIVPEMNARRID